MNPVLLPEGPLGCFWFFYIYSPTILGWEAMTSSLMRTHDLTFAELLAQGELVPLHQHLLQAVQQPAAEPLQQLHHALHRWPTGSQRTQ